MAVRIDKPGQLQVGQFFESCSFHPCLCSSVDTDGNNVEGISLVDGRVQCCSVSHCGLRILTPEEAIAWKFNGPPDFELKPEERWWKYD